MNPFASRFVRPDHNVYRFARDETADEKCRQAFTTRLIQSLHDQRRAAICGPHGTGKTTLLRSAEADLKAVFEHVTWITLTTDKRHSYRELLSPINTATGLRPRSHCLIIDGYEQLPLPSRLALLFSINSRKTVALLITCHRKPTFFPVGYVTGWDEAIARALTAEKLANVAVGARQQLWTAFEQRLQATADKSSKNLRELWFSMYDEFERIRSRTEHTT